MTQSNTDSSLVDSSSGRSNEASRRRAEEAAPAQRPRPEPADAEPARAPARAFDAEAGRASTPDGSDTDQLWQRWWQIQAGFVDAPRSAVAEAHALVGGVVDGIVRQLETQRAQLEQRWSSGQETSTEELRCDLQRYRDFLSRLLSKRDDTQS